MDRENVPLAVAYQVILEHFHAMLTFYGERGVITFRKYLKAYLKPYDLPREEMLALLKSKDPAFLQETLFDIFTRLGLELPPTSI